MNTDSFVALTVDAAGDPPAPVCRGSEHTPQPRPGLARRHATGRIGHRGQQLGGGRPRDRGKDDERPPHAERRTLTRERERERERETGTEMGRQMAGGRESSADHAEGPRRTPTSVGGIRLVRLDPLMTAGSERFPLSPRYPMTGTQPPR